MGMPVRVRLRAPVIMRSVRPRVLAPIYSTPILVKMFIARSLNRRVNSASFSTPLARLHFLQVTCRFAYLVSPPWDSGTTWSKCTSALVKSSSQKTHRNPSRSITIRRRRVGILSFFVMKIFIRTNNTRIAKWWLIIERYKFESLVGHQLRKCGRARFKVPDLKSDEGATSPWVRISPLPPILPW